VLPFLCGCAYQHPNPHAIDRYGEQLPCGGPVCATSVNIGDVELNDVYGDDRVEYARLAFGLPAELNTQCLAADGTYGALPSLAANLCWQPTLFPLWQPTLLPWQPTVVSVACSNCHRHATMLGFELDCALSKSYGWVHTYSPREALPCMCQ
jgi:hypothetical protein